MKDWKNTKNYFIQSSWDLVKQGYFFEATESITIHYPTYSLDLLMHTSKETFVLIFSFTVC
jgi:hypothetical protein